MYIQRTLLKEFVKRIEKRLNLNGQYELMRFLLLLFLLLLFLLFMLMMMMMLVMFAHSHGNKEQYELMSNWEIIVPWVALTVMQDHCLPDNCLFLMMMK